MHKTHILNFAVNAFVRKVVKNLQNFYVPLGKIIPFKLKQGIFQQL